MARWVFAAIGLLATGALVGCSMHAGAPTPSASTRGGAQKTITLGATLIDPPDLTMASTDVLAFTSTALDPLQVEFTRPASQAGKISCRVADPKTLKPGEKPWATFSQNGEGHFQAMVPPGPFPSVCTLAAGEYTFTVHRVTDNPGYASERLGQEGSITVR